MPLSCSSSGTGAAPIAASHASDDERGPRASTTRSASRPATPTTSAGCAGDRFEPVDDDTVAELDARLREHRTPQHPFERRAPARERDEIVVTGPRQLVGERRRQCRGERDLGRAGGEQIGEHVGRTVAQQVAEPRQERVRVPHLRRTSPFPPERGVRRLRHRRRVALEDRHLVTVTRARERGAEAGHPATDHYDVHRRNLVVLRARQVHGNDAATRATRGVALRRRRRATVRAAPRATPTTRARRPARGAARPACPCAPRERARRPLRRATRSSRGGRAPRSRAP